MEIVFQISVELFDRLIVDACRAPIHLDSLICLPYFARLRGPVGEHLKFLVYAGARPVALFAWSSAPWHLGPRATTTME